MINKFWFVVLLMLFSASVSEARRTHAVFFEGTDYELNVYRVFGKERGKTILLIGGIQGDEPGGFLSADIYADMSLLKGNLIVVPRANFHSIVLNQRQINEDMNRKFAETVEQNYEDKVVAILKDLIAESDCLLNLHDGSGFFSETWESSERNPQKYGQCIIADTEQKVVAGRVIDLGGLARRVVDKINREIPDPSLHFHFNNHNTFSDKSIHKVQRKSATFYALDTWGIPAYGVESSKSLPLETKVRHHVYAINAFMEEFKIIPDMPAVNLDEPELKYLIISVNDSLPVVVKNNQVLPVQIGDSVTITHIESNFERGLSADIIGFGSVNDFRKELVIDKAARIAVRKDFALCGNVYLSVEGGGEKMLRGSASSRKNKAEDLLLFRVKVNGKEQIVSNYSTMSLVVGDIINVEDVISDAFDPSAIKVNVKGFVPKKNGNDGEDRGCDINTAKDLWTRHSLDGKGKTYQIIATSGTQIVGKLFIELAPPALSYMLIKTEKDQVHCFKNGGSFRLGPPSQKGWVLSLEDVVSNVGASIDLDVVVCGPGDAKRRMAMNKPFHIPWGETVAGTLSDRRISVMRNDFLMGSVSLHYTQENAEHEQIEKPVNH